MAVAAWVSVVQGNLSESGWLWYDTPLDGVPAPEASAGGVDGVRLMEMGLDSWPLPLEAAAGLAAANDWR